VSSFAILCIAALWLLCWPYRCLPSWAEVIFGRPLPSTSGDPIPLLPDMPPFPGLCYSVLANALLAFSLVILIKWWIRGRRPSKSVLLVSLLGPVVLIVSVPHFLISFDSDGLPESTTGFVRAAYASSVLSDQSWRPSMFFQGRIAGTGDHRTLVLRSTEEGQFLGLDLGPSPARAFRANLSDWLTGRCMVVSTGVQLHWSAAEPRISDFKYVEIAGRRFSPSTGFLIDYSLSFDARHVALFATRHRPSSFGNTFPQRIYVEVQRTEDARVVAAFNYYAKDGKLDASWLGVEGLMVPTGFDQESFVIALWPSAKSTALPLPKWVSPPDLNQCSSE
jgi:hypothetical protein